MNVVGMQVSVAAIHTKANHRGWQQRCLYIATWQGVARHVIHPFVLCVAVQLCCSPTASMCAL